MGVPPRQEPANSGKAAATSTEMAGVDNLLSNTARSHVESGSLVPRHGVEKPWKISRWDKARTFGMASKVLKDARPGAMEALGKMMTEHSSMHSTHKRLSRRFRLLQALVNGDVLEAARSVVEYKQVRAPVQQRIFSVLPRSVAPTVEQGTRCAKTPTPALAKVVAPSGPQNGEKRKRVDDENSVESLSSAPILMERPRKQLKVALSTTAEVARLNSPKTGQKRKNMEEESSVNISKSASTAEETTNKRVKFDIAATTAGTSLDQKSEEVSKKLQEDVSLKRAQFPSTTTGSTDQLKDAESPAATTSVSLDPDESREVPEPTTSINTSKSAYATVQRAIEQLKASMPVDIDTSASRYLDIETNLRTELLKLLDGMNPGGSVDPPLTEFIKETSQKRGSTEAATLEPQMLHTHGTPAHILKSDAIENQSLSPLMAGDGVAPKIYNYKRKRDPTSDEGHPDVRQDMNDAPKREETEQSIQHQSFPKLVIGEWLQDDRPPGSPRVIINGCPPPRKKRSSNNSITALAEGPSPHALARKDRNTEQLKQRVPTTEANVEDFKINFLRRSEQSKARIAPSDIDSTVPAREEPKDVDEAIERWFAAVQKKRDAESRREARRKRREIQVRQAEFRAQQRDFRPVRCSRNLSEAFQRLFQSKRRINNLPAEYGAEVGAKVRLDGFSSPARGWFHESKAARRNNDPRRPGTHDSLEVFEDHLRKCDQRKSFSSRYESQILQ